MVGYDEPGFIRSCSEAIGADALKTLFQTAPKIKTTHSHEYLLPKTSLPQQVFHPLLPFSAENFSPLHSFLLLASPKVLSLDIFP
jgi:hypothetical protein